MACLKGICRLNPCFVQPLPGHRDVPTGYSERIYWSVVFAASAAGRGTFESTRRAPHEIGRTMRNDYDASEESHELFPVLRAY